MGFKKVISAAEHRMNVNIICYLLTLISQLDSNLRSIDFNNLLSGVIETGNRKDVECILSKIPPEYNLDFENLISRGISADTKHGNFLNSGNDVFTYLFSSAPLDYNWDFNQLAATALSVGNH